MCSSDLYQIQYFQNDESFNQMFSQLKFSAQFSVGDGGGATIYNGTYQDRPIEPRTVIISASDANDALEIGRASCRERV